MVIAIECGGLEKPFSPAQPNRKWIKPLQPIECVYGKQQNESEKLPIFEIYIRYRFQHIASTSKSFLSGKVRHLCFLPENHYKA